MCSKGEAGRPKSETWAIHKGMTHVSLRVPGVGISLSLAEAGASRTPTRSPGSYWRMNVTPAPGANSEYETAYGFDPQFIELAIT
jgi:hypothetical protein